MGGVISRRKKLQEEKPAEPIAPTTPEGVEGQQAQDGGVDVQPDRLYSPSGRQLDPEQETLVREEQFLRERAEARRKRKEELKRLDHIPDHVPVRIRKTLQDFLNQECVSQEDLQAAVDSYASEMQMLEQEGRLVQRLVKTGAAGTGAAVNDVRNAIESFLSSPSRNLSASLEDTAHLLLQVDTSLPDGKSFFPAVNPPQHDDGFNPRDGRILRFSGQMPQTSGSHGAFLRNITNEVDLLEAERKVAEQLAEMKHRRQQAQLQHQFIQKLMARKQDEEEIEAVMESAKVLREQKDILRNWQAQQRKLEDLKEQEVLVQKQMDECSAEMKPVLADQRAIKKDIDKFVQDTADNVKNTEELAWLESEERAAADGKRDPITQQEHFRMDFLLFKNDGWNRVEKIRTSKNKEDRKKLENLEVGLNQLRQNLAILQSDLVEVQRRIAAVENTCKKYQDKSLELNRIFERLPTTRHPTAYHQNPEDGLLDDDDTVFDDKDYSSPTLPILMLTVHRARQLETIDKASFGVEGSTSDPYVVIKIGEEELMTTVAKDQDIAPIWEETFEIQVYFELPTFLYVLVKDDAAIDADDSVDDTIGEFRISVSDDLRFPLRRWFDITRKGKRVGEVELGLHIQGLMSTEVDDFSILQPGCDTTHGIDVSELYPGFATEYYFIDEDTGEEGPQLELIKPDATTISPCIQLEAPDLWPDNVPEECVAARWAGFISISLAGSYTFSTESNDGSHLWVGNELVVDNGGLHGMRRKEGRANLAQGLHTLRADFFVLSGTPGMIAKIEGPGTQDEYGASRQVLLEGYHREGWQSLGAFPSVHLANIAEETLSVNHSSGHISSPSPRNLALPDASSSKSPLMRNSSLTMMKMPSFFKR